MDGVTIKKIKSLAVFFMANLLLTMNSFSENKGRPSQCLGGFSFLVEIVKQEESEGKILCLPTRTTQDFCFQRLLVN